MEWDKKCVRCESTNVTIEEDIYLTVMSNGYFLTKKVKCEDCGKTFKIRHALGTESNEIVEA